MKDRFDREIDYLRISLTDRCNLRCIYCMEEEEDFFEKEELLKDEEIIKIVKAFAKLGIKKVRLTGGEPLVRSYILNLIKNIYDVEGVESIYITTNGINLKPMVKDLKAYGVKGVNISLDTLNQDKYKKMTRIGTLEKVLDSIRECLKYDIKVKINTVLIEGLNKDEIFDLINITRENNINLRFIELMPIGIGGKFKGVTTAEIKEIIGKELKYKNVEKEEKLNGPATYIKIEGYKGKVGFISAMSECFCGECNRIRVTSEGFLKTCLHFNYGIDLKKVLRREDSMDELMKVIKKSILNKPEKHNFNKMGKDRELKFMNKIGG